MALKATIYKCNLSLADLDRNYYHQFNLTLARHPSENDARMMLRLLAFAHHANEQLNFTKGLSTDDEPDLWQKNLHGDIELWIELGQPDEKRIKRACNKARKVVIYSYGGGSAPWWQSNSQKLDAYKNLSIFQLDKATIAALAELADRTMQIDCTIQEGQAWFNNGKQNLAIEPATLKP